MIYLSNLLKRTKMNTISPWFDTESTSIKEKIKPSLTKTSKEKKNRTKSFNETWLESSQSYFICENLDTMESLKTDSEQIAFNSNFTMIHAFDNEGKYLYTYGKNN